MPSRPHILPRLIATVAFVGYAPVAPGTAGSLVAALAFLAAPVYLSQIWFLAGFAGLFALAVWSAGRLATAGRPDPSEVVIDEVAGMAATLAFLPLTAANVWTGFVLFRVFDIAKPFPVRRAETLPSGWGIVMDDVCAGVYANLTLRVVLALLDAIAI